MKYTDGMFEFPIRIYDGFSVRKARKREEELNMDVTEDGEWVEGAAEIPLNQYEGCYDFFQSGRTMEDVADNGFDGTIILTKTMGEFICTWRREKFKARINKFAEGYVDTIENHVEEQFNMKKEALENDVEEIKIPKWKQWLIRKLL